MCSVIQDTVRFPIVLHRPPLLLKNSFRLGSIRSTTELIEFCDNSHALRNSNPGLMYANEQLYYTWDCGFTSPSLPGDNEDDSNADDNFLSVTLYTLTPLMPTAYIYICHILLLPLTFIDKRLRKE